VWRNSIWLAWIPIIYKKKLTRKVGIKVGTNEDAGVTKRVL